MKFLPKILVKEKEQRVGLLINLSRTADSKLDELVKAKAPTNKTLMIATLMNDISTNEESKKKFKDFLEVYWQEMSNNKIKTTESSNNFQIPIPIYNAWAETWPEFGFTDRSSYIRALIYFYHSMLYSQEDYKELEKSVAILNKHGFKVVNYSFVDPQKAVLIIDIKKNTQK
jgi:hypothetical protein